MKKKDFNRIEKRIKKEWLKVKKAIEDRLEGLTAIETMYQGFWLSCVHEVSYYLAEYFQWDNLSTESLPDRINDAIVNLYNVAPKKENIFLNLVDNWFNAETLEFTVDAFLEQVAYEIKRLEK